MQEPTISEGTTEATDGGMKAKSKWKFLSGDKGAEKAKGDGKAKGKKSEGMKKFAMVVLSNEQA